MISFFGECKHSSLTLQYFPTFKRVVWYRFWFISLNKLFLSSPSSFMASLVFYKNIQALNRHFLMWDNEPKYTILQPQSFVPDFYVSGSFKYPAHYTEGMVPPGEQVSRSLGPGWLKCKQKFDILRTSHWLGARAVNEPSRSFTMSSRGLLLVDRTY